MAKKGRPKKEVPVTLSKDEILLIAKRLGFSTERDLLDDLAMGVIAPVAPPVDTLTVTPEAECSGKSAGVAQPKSLENLSVKCEKRKSWADLVEETEEVSGVAPAMEPIVNPDLMIPPAVEEAVGGGKGASEVVKESGTEVLPATGPKTWSDVVKGNRAIGNGLSLDFFPVEEVVRISEEDWEEGARLWKFPVVGSIVNARPSYTEVLKWVEVNWKSYAPRVTQLKPGVFVFDFQKEEHRIEVIQRSWSFYHKFEMVLKFWDPDQDVDSLSMNTRPVWVQLPGLKSRLWSNKNLGQIVSYIGRPLATDRMTAERTRLDYARVLVEVKTGGDLPEEIPIEGPKGRILQKVIYEWRIKKCLKCKRFGHEAVECRRKDVVVQEQGPVEGVETAKPAQQNIELEEPKGVSSNTGNAVNTSTQAKKDTNVQKAASIPTSSQSASALQVQGARKAGKGIVINTGSASKMKTVFKGGGSRGNSLTIPNG